MSDDSDTYKVYLEERKLLRSEYEKVSDARTDWLLKLSGGTFALSLLRSPEFSWSRVFLVVAWFSFLLVICIELFAMKKSAECRYKHIEILDSVMGPTGDRVFASAREKQAAIPEIALIERLNSWGTGIFFAGVVFLAIHGLLSM